MQAGQPSPGSEQPRGYRIASGNPICISWFRSLVFVSFSARNSPCLAVSALRVCAAILQKTIAPRKVSPGNETQQISRHLPPRRTTTRRRASSTRNRRRRRSIDDDASFASSIVARRNQELVSAKRFWSSRREDNIVSEEEEEDHHTEEDDDSMV